MSFSVRNNSRPCRRPLARPHTPSLQGFRTSSGKRLSFVLHEKSLGQLCRRAGIRNSGKLQGYGSGVGKRPVLASCHAAHQTNISAQEERQPVELSQVGPGCPSVGHRIPGARVVLHL